MRIDNSNFQLESSFWFIVPFVLVLTGYSFLYLLESRLWIMLRVFINAFIQDFIPHFLLLPYKTSLEVLISYQNISRS